jgi:hypothetical protein
MATVINPPSPKNRIMLIASNFSVRGIDGTLRLGPFSFDPDNWNTDTFKYTLYIIFQVNNAAQSVYCFLYNLDDLEQTGSAPFIHTGDTDPTLMSDVLTVGVAAHNLKHGSHKYECWLSASNVVGVIGTISQMYIQVEHK